MSYLGCASYMYADIFFYITFPKVDVCIGCIKAVFFESDTDCVIDVFILIRVLRNVFLPWFDEPSNLVRGSILL